MQEKRKKFGMEMLPSLHKKLKVIATARDLPLWSLTQQAIEQWLLREVPGKDEQNMTDSTDSSKVVNQIGTFDLAAPQIDRKIASIGHQVDDQEEITSSERSASEIPATRADVARIEAKIEEIARGLAESRAGVGRVASPLQSAKKTTKRADRGRRLDSRRKRGNPSGAQSGA